MKTLTIQKAEQIWSYMSAVGSRNKSDAIVICCSYDLRVCDHACDLINSGYSDRLVISGKTGNWTHHIWNVPEAEIFFERAISNGIIESKILLETEATNFGENVTFSRALIPDAKSVTFVSKPNSLLRVKLTVEALWPEITAFVSSPEIDFPGDVSNMIGVLGVINEMVGDIDRFEKYPALGYQAKHTIPEDIHQAWLYLKDEGFTGHLLPGS